MSQEYLAHLIHAQTAAIADLEDRIRAHEAIRRILPGSRATFRLRI